LPLRIRAGSARPGRADFRAPRSAAPGSWPYVTGSGPQATVRRILGELYYFNEENPTGHYRLNLERKCGLTRVKRWFQHRPDRLLTA
jgi:hypothetical protein